MELGRVYLKAMIKHQQYADTDNGSSQDNSDNRVADGEKNRLNKPGEPQTFPYCGHQARSSGFIRYHTVQ